MILPNKHLKFDRSLLVLGGSLLTHLQEPQTVSRLWTVARDTTEVRSFDQFCLTLSFLFAIKAIAMQDKFVTRLTHD
jgi:ABC-three component (ABC-3C) system Middle Component 6